MCGIAGFFGRENTWETDIRTMNEHMITRGPDARGYWRDINSGITFGHVRLSIVDLSEAGSQPMLSKNSRFCIVLNGEIYNHEDLRKRLIHETGITLRGHSDTEVFLEYIAEYGIEKALDDSIGMFAFALLDRDSKKLILGRDRIGEKPLYYGWEEGKLIFCSDIGAIHDVCGELCTINKDALTLYFRHGYIPAPYTIYKNIKKIVPGRYVEIRYPYHEQDVSEKRYWDLRKVVNDAYENPFRGSYSDAVDELERLLKESISIQMIADVPVGAFLSGGIDSSTIVSIMQSMSERKVNTFSIGFEEDMYNEAIYSKKIAQYLGTNHTELYVSAKDVQGAIFSMPEIYGEPFADSSQLPTYLVSKLAKEKVTVSLSGDGGDELFCGYNSYDFVERVWNKVKLVPYPIRNITSKLLGNGYYYNSNRLDIISRYVASKTPMDVYIRTRNIGWDNKVVLEGNVPDYSYTELREKYYRKSAEENIMLMDMIGYHPDDILTKVDRSSMAVSLESRVPLLDKRIVEFAWSLPLQYKKNQGVSKRILKDVLYRYVPKEMMNRPKKGFSVPVAEWIKNGDLREWAEAELSYNKIKSEGMLDPECVKKTWDIFIDKGYGATKVWYLLMFEEWIKKCG